MSKETTVCILGVLIFLLPFMGLPRAYKEWVLVIIGGILIIIGYSLRRLAFLHSLQSNNGERRADVFVENAGLHKEEEIHLHTQGRQHQV